MKHLLSIGFGIQLAAVAMFAQERSYKYEGDIVNANCLQAAEIVNQNARGYTPPIRSNAFTGTRKKVLQTPRKRDEILRHCPLHQGVTQFALLSDEGNFFKLNEAGNNQVLYQAGQARKMRVTIKGSVDRQLLIVQSLSKQ